VQLYISTFYKIERDDYRCQICGRTNGKLDVHHIIPRRDGGQDSMDNLITVCNGICHKKLEPVREKSTLSITEGTFSRISSLIGKAENGDVMISRLCEELEKERSGSRRETAQNPKTMA
jgi:HNH endonuclease